MELTDILVVEDGEQNVNDAREVLGEIAIARSFAPRAADNGAVNCIVSESTILFTV